MPDQVNILVVDDEQIMRDGCSRILAKEGWGVITAENGLQGLQEIERRPEGIDVCLLDLMMPGLSGMEVLDRIRVIDPELLVIVITGYATVESAVEAMKKGAYDFTPKPFTPDQLRIVVRRALERRNLRKEAEFLRREREKSLRDIAAEKSKLKTIINSMGDGVLVCDSSGCIVLTNPATSLMLGITEHVLLGGLLAECGLPGELVKTIEESLAAGEAGYASVSQELHLGETGQVFLRAHTAPVRNDAGGIMGSVTVLQDISHLKELDRMKSEFIAMVAHELKAPIAGVEQQLSVILSRVAGELSAKQEHLLVRAKERTRGVLSLIKDLLDLSKIEAGKLVQYKEPLSLPEVIRATVEGMKSDAAERGIVVNLFCPEECPLILADRRGMEGVFNNLISNAVKYSGDGRKVTIILDEDNGFIRVTVADDGIGIRKEDLSRIFDRFYRVRTPQTRQIIGTGLGLSIVKSIVEAHHGSIRVESQEGSGASFTVLLPKESKEVACPEGMI